MIENDMWLTLNNDVSKFILFIVRFWETTSGSLGRWHEENRENKKMWVDNFHTNWDVKKQIQVRN